MEGRIKSEMRLVRFIGAVEVIHLEIIPPPSFCHHISSHRFPRHPNQVSSQPNNTQHASNIRNAILAPLAAPVVRGEGLKSAS